MKFLTKSIITTLFLCSTSFATATPEVIQPQLNYQQLTTQRQVVDQLLEQAAIIQKSPARISHAGFTAKLPSNMESIAQLLQQAYELEPYRVDLLFGAANAYIYNGDVDRAIELYNKILNIAPEDTKAHIYLTTWYRFKQNSEKSAEHLQKLTQLSPEKAQQLNTLFHIVDKVVTQPITDKLDKNLSENSAIITLGYALNPDGSMHEILIERLKTTLEIAKQNPNSLIIVTGGVPKNNQTEANLMKQWLVEHGIEAKRIYTDNYAKSTVENALYARYALAKHKIQQAVLISSGSHVRRGQALFELAVKESGPSNLSITSVAALDKPLDELQQVTSKDLLGIYRDSLKVMGLPMFNSGALQD